jgi:hypothetical protein
VLEEASGRVQELMQGCRLNLREGTGYERCRHAGNKLVYDSEQRPQAARVNVEHIKPGTGEPWRQIDKEGARSARRVLCSVFVINGRALWQAIWQV